jgi:hypothetical protein
MQNDLLEVCRGLQAIGPDLICYVTVQGQAFSNDDINVEGEEAVVIGIAAHPALTGHADIMRAFGDALVALGYFGRYVPIAELQRA